MKKTVCTLLILLTFCACSNNKAQTDSIQFENRNIKGVWVTFSEVNGMLENGDFKTDFSSALDEMRKAGITDVFVHVRAFGDSLFKSEYYPSNPRIEQYNFDVLRYMTDICKDNSIRFHAWINRYRTADGTFLDRANSEVRANIINGIREILNIYDVDGIHFDDYFYPSSDTGIDLQSYQDYIKATECPLSLEEYRTANINTLIYSVYKTVKFINKDVVFSVSPAASIDKNKNEFFADVNAWCQNGCVDILIPQLYFGFDYPKEEYRFNNLLNEWESISRAENVSMVIGLAAYKVGTDSEPDREEWSNGESVLKRQSEICLKDTDISGVCYFSLTSLLKLSKENGAY